MVFCWLDFSEQSRLRNPTSKKFRPKSFEPLARGCDEEMIFSVSRSPLDSP
jgi:hypothetical protein